MSSYPEVETLARLLQMTAQYGLEELEVEEDGLRIRLVAGQPTLGEDGESLSGISSAILWRPPVWPDAPAGEAEPAVTGTPINAPLTGTFYLSPNPESPPFVEIGDTIEEGQPVGIIEAMKVFSEVLADRGGVVRRIAAQNGKVIEQGQAVLYLDPDA